MEAGRVWVWAFRKDRFNLRVNQQWAGATEQALKIHLPYKP